MDNAAMSIMSNEGDNESTVKTPSPKKKFGQKQSAKGRRILESKMKLANDPNAIVFVPHTREGHILQKILYRYDKALNVVRRRAGYSLDFDQVNLIMADALEASNQIERAVRLLSEFNPGTTPVHHLPQIFESPDQRRAMAQSYNSYVFIPRTNESRKLIQQIIRIDAQLVHCRTTCTEFVRFAEVYSEVAKAIVNFNNRTEAISKLAGLPYEPPEGITSIANRAL
ncbi:MAG TPA: hypothetical protein PLN56_10105 [Methanoregulaceae archaeon]|nr:hypothetical protein [Methanothrix sp.]HOL44409.1 hypothetical protein [Methanothrix sp.]HPD11328.1 hypothetical protein [Methanoregulaceae archaeon]